jgi:hypothetical protein
MKHCLLFLIFGMVFPCLVSGQNDTPLVTKDTTIVSLPPVKTERRAERRWGDAGVGFGLDYGGIFGVRASFYPVRYMGVFAAGGWEVVGLGWNIGVLGRAVPADGKHSVRPYLKLMYGVNGATKVTGKRGYDKMFYGLTPGIGLETRFGRMKKSGISIDINIPFRSPAFFKQISDMENDPDLSKVTVLPFAISIGYVAEF